MNYLSKVAATLNNSGILYADNQRAEDAEEAYDKALLPYLDIGCDNCELYRPEMAELLHNKAALDFTKPQGQQMFQIVQTLRLA